MNGNEVMVVPLSYTMVEPTVFTTSIGTSTMSFLFARRMTVANSYLGTRWVEGKSAVGQGGFVFGIY